MSKYPRLTEMGVSNPEQIEKFSVNSMNYIDYLRITYDRPKGSLLPVRRTYEFPRIRKYSKAGSAKGEDQIVMESDSALRDAVLELRQICGARASKQNTVASIREELRRLDEEFTMRRNNLETLIDNLDDSQAT